MKLLIFLSLLSFIALAASRPRVVQHRGPVPFVVGGQPSAKGRFPHQLSQQRRSADGDTFGHGCGAVLIRVRWALTAAHCFLLTDDPDDYRLLLGAFRIMPESQRDAEQDVGVTQIVEHPDFDFITPGLPNDIALMELDEDANTNSPNIATVELGRDSLDYAGNPNCWITGWGRTSGDAEGASPILMELNIPVLTNTECQRRWDDSIIGAIHPILDVHICVGDEDGRLSACQGDSGGPMTCNDEGTVRVTGITSRGFPTCELYPSVYTRVSKYISWIESIVD